MHFLDTHYMAPLNVAKLQEFLLSRALHKIVCGLEKLLKICERKLNFLDMSVNFKKCSCIS